MYLQCNVLSLVQTERGCSLRMPQDACSDCVYRGCSLRAARVALIESSAVVARKYTYVRMYVKQRAKYGAPKSVKSGGDGTCLMPSSPVTHAQTSDRPTDCVLSDDLSVRHQTVTFPLDSDLFVGVLEF
ncbi:hypothetical protein M8J75_002289 [Diaphorina citri]|nr:hypothetical protein M8J75_002289 [Diaphorina citri]